MSNYRSIVVPYDFSEHSRAALHVAVDLAKRLDSDLHLVHVIQPISMGYVAYGAHGAAVTAPVDILELREIATNALAEVADGIDEVQIDVQVVEGASVDESIREAADKVGADLIVMGTHGRTGLAHVFLGSVTEHTLRRAPCPVLTVRAPDAQAAA